MILATSARRVDSSIATMLDASKRAKLILPKARPTQPTGRVSLITV